ncbi:MAG: putative lipid II flippase FtsW [Deltaproteobacteria bacterium]|nr:putative lipid II flippase FtsW [Deltaproteobacteria bacterium]
MAKRGWDPYLLFPVLALVLLGIVMVYSSSSILADQRFRDDFFFLKKQALFAGLGVGALLVLRNMDYLFSQKLALPLLLLCLGLLLLLFLPGFRMKMGGATRWLRVGPFSFQPSELAKLALIIYLAAYISRKGPVLREFRRGLLVPLCITGFMAVLITRQPDLGMAFTVTTVALLLLFFAGARLRHLLTVGLATLPFLYLAIARVGYRQQRVTAFLNPWEVASSTGFQIIQSFLAFGSGGPLGAGLGEGRQKLFFLPEPHTDFIFALIGEELGLLGVLIVVACFVVFFWRGIAVGLRAPDLFGSYLALGITLNIGLQALINMAVVLGLLPTKGLTLPFVSYGGTSLLVNLMAVGLLLSVSAQCRR